MCKDDESVTFLTLCHETEGVGRHCGYKDLFFFPSMFSLPNDFPFSAIVIPPVIPPSFSKCMMIQRWSALPLVCDHCRGEVVYRRADSTLNPKRGAAETTRFKKKL